MTKTVVGGGGGKFNEMRVKFRVKKYDFNNPKCPQQLIYVKINLASKILNTMKLRMGRTNILL